MNQTHPTTRSHDWLALLGGDAHDPQALAAGMIRLARLAVAEHQAQAALSLPSAVESADAPPVHAASHAQADGLARPPAVQSAISPLDWARHRPIDGAVVTEDDR